MVSPSWYTRLLMPERVGAFSNSWSSCSSYSSSLEIVSAESFHGFPQLLKSSELQEIIRYHEFVIL